MRPQVSTGTAHRPTREDRKAKEYQELRRENHHLSREVARLRKHLAKATDTKQSFESDEPEPTEPAVASPAGPYCPKCPPESSSMRAIDVPSGTLWVCADCKHRFVQRS